jgi:hypothetical protein
LETALATRRLLALSILCVAVLFLAPKRSVNAGDDWLPIDPPDLKMSSEPMAPGAPAIYLYRQVDRDDSGRATSERNYVRIKILTEEGRKYANVEIPFNKEKYKVSLIRARTIRPDGSVVNFDGKVFENTIVKSKSVKYLAKTFSLSEATVGSIVEYKYTYDFEDNYIFNSHWILSEELFTRKGEFSLKPYARDTWRVMWISPAGLPKGTEQAKEAPDHVVRMTANNIPAFQTEDYMPPENELKFRVDFIYQDSIPEMDVTKFWVKYGKKQNDKVESFVGKHKAMEEAVTQIVSPTDSPDVKLQKIYARTQQIRNLSYETSKTEQEEKREKLRAESNVEGLWKNGYGNGWNITWLFLALTRAAGFEAYPCMVSGRSEYFFKKERLNSSELDANVVLVKLNGKDLYFDPGAQFTPYGMLPWMETDVAGLKLDKEGGKWIITSLPESSDSKVERVAKLNLTDQGSLEGKLKVTYTGLAGLGQRAELRNEDEAERKKYLEDEIKESIPVMAEVELTNKPNWNSSAEGLVAEFDLRVQGWASGAGKNALLPASLFGAQEKHLFEHAERVYPVYFRYPYKKVDDVEIELPLGWKVGNVPKPFDQDLKAAEFKLRVENEGTKVRIQREIRSDLVMVPKDMYPSLRGFFQIVRTQDDQQIVVQPVGASASH